MFGLIYVKMKIIQLKQERRKMNLLFFSCKIDKNRLKEESIFKIESLVGVSGIPKSYLNKKGYKQFNIFVLEKNW